MKNQDTQQPETSVEQTQKSNNGRGSPMAGLAYGIIVTVFTVIGLMASACGSSRQSSSSEIVRQEQFQEKWNAAQKEAEQKWDSTLKATEQK